MRPFHLSAQQQETQDGIRSVLSSYTPMQKGDVPVTPICVRHPSAFPPLSRLYQARIDGIAPIPFESLRIDLGPGLL